VVFFIRAFREDASALKNVPDNRRKGVDINSSFDNKLIPVQQQENSRQLGVLRQVTASFKRSADNLLSTLLRQVPSFLRRSNISDAATPSSSGDSMDLKDDGSTSSQAPSSVRAIIELPLPVRRDLLGAFSAKTGDVAAL
jgi:hypothetical protein